MLHGEAADATALQRLLLAARSGGLEASSACQQPRQQHSAAADGVAGEDQAADAGAGASRLVGSSGLWQQVVQAVSRGQRQQLQGSVLGVQAPPHAAGSSLSLSTLDVGQSFWCGVACDAGAVGDRSAAAFASPPAAVRSAVMMFALCVRARACTPRSARSVSKLVCASPSADELLLTTKLPASCMAATAAAGTPAAVLAVSKAVYVEVGGGVRRRP
jgi:hypothetical protein